VRMAAAAALDLNKRSMPQGSTVPSADLSASARLGERSERHPSNVVAVSKRPRGRRNRQAPQSVGTLTRGGSRAGASSLSNGNA
jgi:hypothetical protein